MMRATLVGIVAILLWSLLALFTAASGTVPPFQLVAICFAIASFIGMIALWRSGQGISVLKQPVPVWLLGVGAVWLSFFLLYRVAPRATC